MLTLGERDEGEDKRFKSTREEEEEEEWGNFSQLDLPTRRPRASGEFLGNLKKFTCVCVLQSQAKREQTSRWLKLSPKVVAKTKIDTDKFPTLLRRAMNRPMFVPGNRVY